MEKMDILMRHHCHPYPSTSSTSKLRISGGNVFHHLEKAFGAVEKITGVTGDCRHSPSSAIVDQNNRTDVGRQYEHGERLPIFSRLRGLGLSSGHVVNAWVRVSLWLQDLVCSNFIS